MGGRGGGGEYKRGRLLTSEGGEVVNTFVNRCIYRYLCNSYNERKTMILTS